MIDWWPSLRKICQNIGFLWPVFLIKFLKYHSVKSVWIWSFSGFFFHSKSSRYEQFLRSVRFRRKPYSGIFFALLQNAYLWRKGKFNVRTVFLLINSQFCDICIWRRKGFSSYFEHTNISLSFFRNLGFFAFLFFYVFFFLVICFFC